MITQRKLILVCGLSATGKSRGADYVMNLFPREDPRFFDMDEVREKTWGERAKNLTSEEHRFKNKLTRNEVQKAFVLGARIVVLNMVMPSKNSHQKPFVEMVRETERMLSQIEFEREVGGWDPGPHPDAYKITIDVRALWFDCDQETARKRLEERAKNPHVSDLTDIKIWLRNKATFEPPDGENYPFIRVDTTDESVDAEQRRQTAIKDFVI